MAKAIGYFRESVPRADGDASLVEQNRAFIEFCRKEGFEVDATFLDTDPANDTGLRQLIDYVQQYGCGATVVVDSLQRLGPDIRRRARAYFQLQGLGAQVLTLDASAGATEALIASWKERDVTERMGERVRAAMQQKAIKGEVLGRAPYGYGISSRRRLTPLPEEAGVVRYIFRLYNQDALGIRLIARRLNEEGYRTRRGGNWSMVSIRDILKNRVYLGTYSRFGVRVPGSHPAIVTADDYRRAQDRMERRRTGGGRRSVHPFALSGLAYCGYCGNRMIGVSRRQSWHRQGEDSAVQAEYRYYQCETRTNQGMCGYHTHRAAELEEEVRGAVELEVRRLIATSDGTVGGDVRDDLRSLKSRLRQLDRHLEQLLEAGARGRMPAGAVRDQSVEIAQQQLALQAALAETERRAWLSRDAGQRHAAQQELLHDLNLPTWTAADATGRRRLLAQILKRAVVYDSSIHVVLSNV